MKPLPVKQDLPHAMCTRTDTGQTKRHPGATVAQLVAVAPVQEAPEVDRVVVQAGPNAQAAPVAEGGAAHDETERLSSTRMWLQSRIFLVSARYFAVAGLAGMVTRA